MPALRCFVPKIAELLINAEWKIYNSAIVVIIAARHSRAVCSWYPGIMARTLPHPDESLEPLASDLEALGALVRNQRARSRLRIDDAADLLGVSKDLLSKLENGGPVGTDKLLRVLNGLGLMMLVANKTETRTALSALLQSRSERT
ncbi:helix-turn-helix domain-containing protein [Cupriavidus sp. BIC8F]|uniref:helix-turn-helix domain-containing protein n=1 Tax=Cupriavidus sp. BIC8F TaxID=3079014 RepID=UPI003967555A